MTDREVVVIGAGPAGLTASYLLAKAGRSVTVLEAHPHCVGGIARTVERDGFRFDVGPHRFFSKSPEIEALGDEEARVRLQAVEGLRKLGDARALPWQAFRYNIEGVWIENAAGFGPNPYEPDKPPTHEHDYLIYPGTQFGLKEQVVPSARLKRLRRGIDLGKEIVFDGDGDPLHPVIP